MSAILGTIIAGGVILVLTLFAAPLFQRSYRGVPLLANETYHHLHRPELEDYACG